jgi:uracil-DNA glycosylase family 4
MDTTSTPTSDGPDTSLSQRRHPLAKCEACGLNDPANAFVPSLGEPGATVAIIGEAPGFQEAQKGIPFTGPSGQLLDAVLKQHDIDKRTVWLSNACLCRPPDNRTPTPSEVRACAPRLQGELQVLRPRHVVTLGATASQVVLGSSEPITKLRVGPPRPGPQWLPSVEVIPTFHPAYCLRSSDAFPSLQHDISKLRGDLRVDFEPPTYKVFDDEVNARAVLDILHRRGDHELTVDIETGLEKDFADAHAEDHEFLCVGIGYEPGRVAILGEMALKHPSVQQELGALLEERGWVAHNGKFDLGTLRRWGSGRLVFDTMLASYALDERPGTHGLKYLATELLGAPAYDRDVQRYVGKGGSYANIPRDKLYRYNAYDVGCTQLLRIRFGRELEAHGLTGVNDLLTKLSPVLMRMEERGLNIDLEYLDYLTEHYLDGLESLERALGRWVANPRSPQQVKRALADMGHNVQSTDKDNLDLLQEIAFQTKNEELAQFIELMIRQRKEQKLYGTYIKGTRKRLYRGRVHSTFLLHGTTTGRQASRNPNLFNVPRESAIRRMFVPGPGNVFVQADYATIELRVLATLAKDPFLRDLFVAGRDMHNEFSDILYGPGNWGKEQRVRTKAFVYGVSYGREAFSIAMEYGIPVQEAQAHMLRFTSAIPHVMEFRKQIKEQALHGDDDLITHFGRHRRYHLITRDNMKDIVKEAYAFVPQSTAADIMHHALLKLDAMGLDLRLTVYDSILAECSPDDADDVARTMDRVMTETAKEVFSDYVPFPVDIHIGKSWGDV